MRNFYKENSWFIWMVVGSTIVIGLLKMPW